MNMLSKEQVLQMNYPDFIGFMGMENTSLLEDFDDETM